MLTILKTTGNGIEILPELCDGSWINVIDPTPDESARLQELGIPRDFITYPLDLDERARMEKEDDHVLIVLRIPLYQGETEDIPFATVPLGIILNGRYVVTVCKYHNEVVEEMANGRVRGLSTGKRNRFLLHVLLIAATKFLSHLRNINRTVDLLEDKAQLSVRNRELYGLLKYQKSLVYFTTALKSNELMMERLQRSGIFRTFPDDEDLLEDVLTENRQAIEMTTIASNILSSTMDSFASIISNNLNQVMKVLASATIVLALPTWIASLFGMNVPVPMENSSYAFIGILGMSFALVLVVVMWFLKRDWI